MSTITYCDLCGKPAELFRRKKIQKYVGDLHLVLGKDLCETCSQMWATLWAGFWVGAVNPPPAWELEEGIIPEVDPREGTNESSSLS